MRASKGKERGFSLVEVVVALGLMAGVLISISGLFVIGARSVNSGRKSSEALAVGRQILEEMNGWGFKQTYQLYGWDGSATSYTADTRTNAYALKWQPILASRLGNDAFGTVQVASIAQGAPPALNTSNCKAIRVVVTVFWNEGGTRSRNVVIGTVRM